jgi:type I restriction enzyme S subunit
MGSKPATRDGWTRVRFGDIAEHINERVDDPNAAGVDRYVGLEHLDPESIRVTRWGSPDEVSAQKLRFHPGDIIFGKRRAYQRKVAVADFEGICSAHAMVLRERKETVAPGFLIHFMAGDVFMERAIQISVGSLSPTINWSTLRDQEFDLPPFDEQRTIARLCAASTLAYERAAMLAQNSAQMCDGLAAALVTGALESVPAEFRDALTPDKWHTTTLGDVCTLNNGHGFRPSDWDTTGYPIIRIQNVRGSTEFNYFGGEPEPKWLVHPGELLFAWAGVPGVSFGPGIWQGPVGVLNQHIYRVTPNPGVDTYWLYEVLRYLTPLIEKRAHGFKASLLHIKKKEFTSQVVKWPGVDQVKALSAALRKVRAIHAACADRLGAANRLRVSALQQIGTRTK